MKFRLIGACAALLFTFVADANVPGIPTIGFYGPTATFRGNVAYETRTFTPEAFGGGLCAVRNPLGTWSYFGYSIVRVDFSGKRSATGKYRAMVCNAKFTMPGAWRVGSSFTYFQKDGSSTPGSFSLDVNVF